MTRNNYDNKVFSTKIITFLIIIIIFFQLLAILPVTEGKLKNTFGDNSKEKIITFPDGGGIDESINISIEYGTSLLSASLNLTPITTGDKYMSELFLDVSQDNDYEWAFSGLGYGALGRQTIFNDSSASIARRFITGPSQVSSAIRLPKTTDIKSAQLNISGSFFEFPLASTVDGSLGQVYNLEVGDLDNDNDTDLIVSYRTQVSPFDFLLAWYENTAGDGSVWTRNSITVPTLIRAYGLAVDDLDGDNDLDIVISDNPWSMTSSSVIWFNNTNGDGSAWTYTTVDSSFSTAMNDIIYDIVIADMNNDSYKDIVGIYHNVDNNEKDVFWYKNDYGNGSSWTLYNITKSVSRACDLVVADIDDDGDNDTAICTDLSNQVIWYSNNNGIGTSWSSAYVIEDSMSNVASIDIGDIDKDNNTDIVAIDSLDTVWFEAPDDPTQVASWVKHNVGVGLGTSGGIEGEIKIIDMGYDKRKPDDNLDIITVSQSTYDVLLFKNDGTPLDGGWGTIVLNRDHDDAYRLAYGDIDGDSYNDTVVGSVRWSTLEDIIWYRLDGSSPSNVTINLGRDAQVDWVHPGNLETTETYSNFVSNLTQYISQSSVFKDEYGNKFVYIPITIETETSGSLMVSDLEITYDYTATVDINPHGNLASELNEALSTTPPDSTGNTTVQFRFKSHSSGSLKVHDLKIEYNDFPWFIQELPEVITLPEDSKNDNILDLSAYVADDYLSASELSYNIFYTTGPGAGIVSVDIFNNHFVGGDALSGSENDNWTGYLDFKFDVSDNFGSTIESDLIRLMVTPVNDEPILGPADYQDLILTEGGTSIPMDLDAVNYFIDVDGDPLYFEIEIDPSDIIFNENITFDLIADTNIVTFTAENDWYDENLPVRIYCDDSKPVNHTLYKNFLISVFNVNDPPKWSKLPDIFAEEDSIELNIINLINYVTDPDDEVENITFSLTSNTNSEAIQVIINDRNYIDIYPQIPEYQGSTHVTLRASDPGQNYSEASFNVTYIPVNDPPEVDIITPRQNSKVPSESVIITWEGWDIDSPNENLTYDVFLGENKPPPALEDAKGLKENQYITSNLQNKMTYYCRIMVSDGDKFTLSEVTVFRVDLAKQPKVKLVSPKHGAVFPEQHVSFDWEVVYSGGYELTYDLYLDTFKDPMQKSPEYTGLSVSELMVYDLEPDKSYYWTVIPKFELGYGICDNGIYNFTIDTSKIAYGLNIHPSETEIRITQGDYHTFEIEFMNLGTSDELIEIIISPLNISNNIEILSGESISIESESSKVIEFTIDSSNIARGQYIVTFQVKSKLTPAKDQENITLEIVKPKSKSKDTQIFETFTDFLPILIMVIVLIIGLIVIIRYKPKEEPRVSDRLAAGTEISFKPPLEAISGRAWDQPQARGGEQVPSIGPYSATSQVPQLPPRHTYTTTPTTPEPTVPEPTLEYTEPIPETGPQVMLPEDIIEELEPIPPEEPITKVEPPPEVGELLPLTEMPEESIPVTEEQPIEPEVPKQEIDQEIEKLGILPEELAEEPSPEKEPGEDKSKKDENSDTEETTNE